MKVAIASEGSDLESSISRRLGISPYLLIVDSESGTLEAVRNPASGTPRSARIQAVVQLVRREV